MGRGPDRWRAVGALFLLVALTPGCGSGEKDGDWERSAPTVEVLTVRPETLSNVVEFIGQLNSSASVMIKPEISGVIESIEFDEGKPITKDAVLFRLRNQEQAAELREAEAQADLAATLYARTRKLTQRNISAKTELDRARAEYRVTQATVERKRVEVEKTVIRAPFDGVVGARLVSLGERVDDDTPLVRIDAIDTLQLVFTVPESSIRLAAIGGVLNLRVKPYPEHEFRGEVFFVAPTVDTRTRRMLVKAWVPNPEWILRPGLFADVTVEIDRREDALVVPESAIVFDQDGPYVWRLDQQNLAWRVSVELGLRQRGRVQIASGLEPEMRIVSAGTHKVSSGESVVIAGSKPEPRIAADTDVASPGEGS